MTQTANQPFRIVILGGGTAGWMTAAGLRHQLPQPDYSVTLIESDEIGTVGVGEATLPHIKIFNDMLGINEAQFMRETSATFKLGIEFRGWDRPDKGYIHPFGAYGEPLGGIDFQHHWLRARDIGRDPGPLDFYSFAVAAAHAGAFDFPTEDSASIRSTYAYAYHFDAGCYADFLRRWSTARGALRIEGLVASIERNDANGDVTGLVLRSGARIEGDLFVDCSGFRSLLVGQTMEVAWQDWTHWLPCDRALAVPCARVAPPTPYTRATAREAGWIWRIPLQHRTGNGYVFSSRFADEDQARRILLDALDGDALGEPRLLRFAPGRRERAWASNCVAIGLSSGFLEPLESTSIYLIQAAIIDLLTLMPKPGSARVDERLSAEFNRLAEMQYERVRDFLILHYVMNRRKGEPMWDYLRSAPLPDTLRHKIALFRGAGIAPDYQYGLFARDSWLSVLIGQGVMPDGYSPLADGLAPDYLAERLNDLRDRIAGSVAAMSSHEELIASYCATGIRAAA